MMGSSQLLGATSAVRFRTGPRIIPLTEGTMMQEIELVVQATARQSKTIRLPEDWDEMTENDRKDYLAEEAADFVLSSVKFGGKVVES
jgi:hypothetical protein